MDYGLTLTCSNSQLILKVCIFQHPLTALRLTARSVTAYGKTKEEEEQQRRLYNNFYRCTVHFDIYKDQKPTNALFIKLDKVFKIYIKNRFDVLRHSEVCIPVVCLNCKVR